MKTILAGLAVVAAAISAGACAPVLEATRPDPVDVHQFVIGEDRIKVLAEIGSPISSTPNAGQSCDIYKLYTAGPGSVEKGAIAAGEVAADILTLGLTEVVSTPVEAATRNSKHTVVFCYTPDNKLASMNVSDSHVDN